MKTKIEKTLEEILKELKKLNDREKQPYIFNPPIQNQEEWSDCLHENCPGCKAGTCSGIHMISCPCRKCTPWAICQM